MTKANAVVKAAVTRAEVLDALVAYSRSGDNQAMDQQAANSLTVFLLGFAGVFLLTAASSWIRLIRDPKRSDENRVLSVNPLQSTATLTAIALGVLAVAMLWLALTVVVAM